MSSGDTIRETTPASPTYRVDILPRLHSVVVFDEHNPVNYIVSCQIFTYGDVGLIFTLNGQRFYDCFGRPGVLQKLFDDLGILTLEGYVTPAHARLMAFASRRVANVEETRRGRMAGHEMIWVRITCKSD